MLIVFALLAASQPTAATKPACDKLMENFVQNEKAFGIIYEMNRGVLEADETFAKATGNYDGISRRLQQNAASDEKFRVQGDRITTLMAAQGCPMPDHVTSPTPPSR